MKNVVGEDHGNHCSADYELSAYVEYVGSALGCIRSLDNADTVNADARLRG